MIRSLFINDFIVSMSICPGAVLSFTTANVNGALNFDAIKPVSLYKTLDLIDRKLKGWGNHYSFCNAKVEMNVLDITMDKLLSEFIEKYNKKLAKLKPSHIREKIGIQRVTNCKHDPIIK